MTISLNKFIHTSEYRDQKDVVMFRYNKKICVMGLWGKCFMNSKDFVDVDDAISWFRHLRRSFSGERQRVKELWRF